MDKYWEQLKETWRHVCDSTEIHFPHKMKQQVAILRGDQTEDTDYLCWHAALTLEKGLKSIKMDV